MGSILNNFTLASGKEHDWEGIGSRFKDEESLLAMFSETVLQAFGKQGTSICALNWL